MLLTVIVKGAPAALDLYRDGGGQNAYTAVVNLNGHIKIGIAAYKLFFRQTHGRGARIRPNGLRGCGDCQIPPGEHGTGYGQVKAVHRMALPVKVHRIPVAVHPDPDGFWLNRHISVHNFKGYAPEIGISVGELFRRKAHLRGAGLRPCGPGTAGKGHVICAVKAAGAFHLIPLSDMLLPVVFRRHMAAQDGDGGVNGVYEKAAVGKLKGENLKVGVLVCKLLLLKPHNRLAGSGSLRKGIA